MATEETTTDDGRVSREAHDRVKHDLDAAKAELSELKPMLADIAFRDAAYEVFKASGESDPYGLATAATADVTIKSTPREELGDKLPQWLEQRRSAFGVVSAPPASEAPKKPETPFAAPNPAAPGTPSSTSPMVLGSKEFKEWAKGRDTTEKLQAMRDGRVVTPDHIRKAHESLRTGFTG